MYKRQRWMITDDVATRFYMAWMKLPQDLDLILMVINYTRIFATLTVGNTRSFLSGLASYKQLE